ncbi:MAG TPA: hypothetical protein ENN35_05480 [Deltaproteobacteria bacterium]|nr:hypothetical protein [Deltaproteobacteria bacterium]
MSGRRMKSFSKVLVATGIVALAGSLFLSGCSTTPMQLNPDITDPQLIVNPASIRLGVANVAGTAIVFEGSGFKPEDSVFISLIGPGDTDAALANGTVEADGTFRAVASPLAKVTGILRANISGSYDEDGSYNQFVVLTKPLVPPGVYTARATAMLSGQSAETDFIIKEAAGAQQLKDWLGIKLGKIVDKRPR